MSQTAEISEKAEIGRASAVMAFFTLLSRLLGLVRNQILSHYFGAGFVADAFIAAFTIPNALRRLFGEGALTPAIVAVFTRSLRQPHSAEKRPYPWQSFISSAFVWLSLSLIILCALGYIFAAELVALYVPKFSDTPGKMELTISLTRFLFPFILFIGWSAFFMGLLNTLRSFAVSAFVPAMLSFSVMAIVPVSLSYLFPNTPHGIYFYAGAMLVGSVLQAALQLPGLKQKDALPLHSFKWKDPRVLELGKLLLPSFFSLAIYQLNLIINRTFASSIDGAVSHLFYADLLLELPVSLIATSLGTAILPSFSRLMADGKKTELADTFKFSLETVWILALPCMAGLIALATPLISTLYFTGEFTLEDTSITSRVLIFYSLGLPFFATLRIVVGLFFAAQNTFIPMVSGWIALLVNLVAAWQLSHTMAASGIALATSLSSATNVFFLIIFVRTRFPEIAWWDIIKNGFKISIAAAFMGVLLFAIQKLIPNEVWTQKGISLVKIIFLGGLVITGSIIYFGAAMALKIPHANIIIRKWTNRLLSKK